MLDLGFLSLLTIAAAGFGLRLLDRLGGRPEARADALALAIPLGLGTLALATLALGELGLLNRMGLGAVLAGGVVLGGCEIGRILRRVRREDHPGPARRRVRTADPTGTV